MQLLSIVLLAHLNRFRLRIFRPEAERGVTTTEYAIMMVLIAIAVAGSSPGVRNAVVNTFAEVSTTLNSAGASSS